MQRKKKHHIESLLRRWLAAQRAGEESARADLWREALCANEDADRIVIEFDSRGGLSVDAWYVDYRGVNMPIEDVIPETFIELAVKLLPPDWNSGLGSYGTVEISLDSPDPEIVRTIWCGVRDQSFLLK